MEMILYPYISCGTWVFDDPATGLKAEAFVLGIPAMIDRILALTAWMRAPQGRFATIGRYRKSLRCYGCGRLRCQLCHPEKFPKRIPTLREKLVDQDLRDYQQSDDARPGRSRESLLLAQ